MIDYNELEDGSYKLVVPAGFDGHAEGAVLVIPDNMNNGDRAIMQGHLDADPATAQIIAYNSVLPLAEQKIIRNREINEQTDALILAGVNHNGVDFKINIEKEVTALGLHTQRVGGADMTGKKFRAKDTTYTFADTADFDAWFAAAMTRVEDTIIAGSELKDQIDAAADQAALDAIVDNRT